jgi:hypothetical protein
MTTLQDNQFIIELNEAGMKYYINSIFASDFIHDFGGSSNKRLNSLGKKVDEMRKMIGFDVLVGGRVATAQPFATSQPFIQDNDSNMGQYLDLPKSKVPVATNITQGFPPVPPPLATNITEGFPPVPPPLATNITEGFPPVPPPVAIKTTGVSPAVLPRATETTESLDHFANIDPQYIEYVYINSVLDENYGSYDILEPNDSVISDYELEAARKILELKGKIREDTMTDEPENLAMLHKSLNYELNEYASEIILGITSYIGSKQITIDEPSTSIETTDTSRLMGGGVGRHLGGRAKRGGGSGDSAPSGALAAASLPTTINQTYDSIISANSTLRVKIEKSYDKTINEVIANIIENQDSEELTNLLIDLYNIEVSKKEELEILDESIYKYIDSYFDYILPDYIIPDNASATSTTVSPKFWFPKPNTDNLTPKQVKQYFKLRAELNDIVNKYFVYTVSTTRSGAMYQGIRVLEPMPINAIINNLLYVIFNQPQTERLIIDIDAKKRIIESEYVIESIRNSISSLCEVQVQDRDNFIRKLLLNGDWETITDHDSFAIELLHSSYFNSIMKEIILNKLKATKLVHDYDDVRVRGEVSSVASDILARRRDTDWQVEQDIDSINRLFAGIAGADDIVSVSSSQSIYRGGAPPAQPIKDGGCINGVTICNEIKQVCSEIGSMTPDDIKAGSTKIVQIFELQDQLVNELFDTSQIQTTTQMYLNKIKNDIQFKYSKLQRARPKQIQDFSVIVGNMYEELKNKYCSDFFSDEKKRVKIEQKEKKKTDTDKKREEAGRINVEWSNKLTEYVARSSLIITESVVYDDSSNTYKINERELNRIKEKINFSENDSIGNWLFYLSILRVLLHQADYLKDNKETMNGYLTDVGDAGNSIANTKGVLDEKTIESARIILEKLFPRKNINQDSILSKWKSNKSLINNALSKWPLKLSSANSFCPLSSINDGQPTCSSYSKEKKKNNIEVANMNVQFQDDENSSFYNLINIMASSSPPRGSQNIDFNICKIIVNAYLGSGFQDTTVVSGENTRVMSGNLVFQKNINLNIEADDKTLDAVNVLRTVIDTLREMWRGIYNSYTSTGIPVPGPEEMSNTCWDAMLSKYNYYNFLSCSHFKALGDTTQELNGALKFGGYTSAGIRNYPSNQIYFAGIPSNRRNTSSPVSNSTGTFVTGNIVPFNAQGNAPRGTLSNDRQAGARSIWLLTCLSPDVINQDAIGGYSSRDEYILARAVDESRGEKRGDIDSNTIVQNAKRQKRGGTSIYGKKTRIVKKHKKRTRVLKKKHGSKKTRITKKSNKKTRITKKLKNYKI